MLKEDPNILKSRDRLSSILSRVEGVELVPYTPGVSPEGAVDLDSIVWSTSHLGRSDMVDVEFSIALRPFAMILTSSNEGAEFERAIQKGLNELREHLAGQDRAAFRPMHLPFPGAVLFARPITLDRFPVRVVHNWDHVHGAYRTTFDAHRPRAGIPQGPLMQVAEDQIVKLKGGRYYVATRMTRQGDKLILQFPYNQDLLAEVKVMAGARWHPDDDERYWSVKDCERNHFQLQYLTKDAPDPYAWYDQELVEVEFSRPLRSHQVEGVRVGLTLKRVLLGAEQGLGKSLIAIEVMERSGVEDWFYVGPRSAIASFEVELANWDSGVIPSIMTYERLQKMVENWPPGRPIPGGVIFDESQRIKTPTSGRSVAAARLAEVMRREWGDEAYILELSGTPAPKDPTDYWHQCEVACPGFLREGNLKKFEARLISGQEDRRAGRSLPAPCLLVRRRASLQGMRHVRGRPLRRAGDPRRCRLPQVHSERERGGGPPRADGRPGVGLPEVRVPLGAAGIAVPDDRVQAHPRHAQRRQAGHRWGRDRDQRVHPPPPDQ